MTILITIIVISGSSLFYYITVQQYKESEFEHSKIISERVSNQIDDLYKQMDIAASALIYSPQLKQNIFILNNESQLTRLETIELKKDIQKNLGTIMFFKGISNVNLFNKLHGYFYYAGLYIKDMDYVEKSLSKRTYCEELEDNNTPLLILSPHDNPWLENSLPVISLCKNFADSTTTKETIVEIQAPYSELANIANQEGFGNEKEIIIFDEEFNLIYPYNDQVKIIDESKVQNISEFIRSNVKQKYTEQFTFTSSYSAYTKFHTVLVSNNSTFQTERSGYIVYTIVFCLIILTTTLFILFIITKRLSYPLKQLIDHIDRISIDDDIKLSIHHSGFDEFEQINDSFNHMLTKLKESMNIAFEYQIRESNANLSALQAQINPHFLYNTLNCIGAASEIYGGEVTSKMCQQLSFMMRYVTSNTREVRLIDEINHTKHYLELMEVANEGDFTYTIDIPYEMYDIMIPKLTIQPIVENSFKHAFKECLPPWNIKIEGEMTADYWRISFGDNGSGFSPVAITELQQFIVGYQSVQNNRVYQNLAVDGMGLKNIYARFSIFFDKHITFVIHNLDKGCEIILKRRIEHD